MDTQTLRTFLALAEIRNFTHTAEHLFVAQSTVTNRIADLEVETGKRLLNRDKKSVNLTEEGKLFLSYAKRMLELEEISLRELQSSTFYPYSLRIGTTNTIYECHLDACIRNFIKSRSDTSTKVLIGHSQNLLQQLQDNLLDLVFSYLPMHKNGYECIPFLTDELILVTDFSNKAYKDGIKKEELIHIKYLFCNFALQEVGLFIRELFPPFYQFAFEIDNSTKLVPYLLEGMGYSFLPQSLVSSYLESGALRSIPLLDFETPKINSYCICRKHQVALRNDFMKLNPLKVTHRVQ